ncbi:calcium-binding protein [Yoonia sp. 208BN28-4]|uniref:calcium-binding protein n=1 Tax=Yoonia sp. 208BN28-4 TaxID=3126505 RepID=UPI00309C660A
MKTTFLIAAMTGAMLLPALDAAADGPREKPDFATLDTNGDGTLTLEELQSQGRFATADANDDGVLSQDELTAAAQGRAAMAVERMLSRLDENGDGAISQDELPDRGDRAERMFSRVDANDDGAISAEEFEEMRAHRGEGRGRGSRHHDGNGPRDRG